MKESYVIQIKQFNYKSCEVVNILIKYETLSHCLITQKYKYFQLWKDIHVTELTEFGAQCLGKCASNIQTELFWEEQTMDSFSLWDRVPSEVRLGVQELKAFMSSFNLFPCWNVSFCREIRRNPGRERLENKPLRFITWSTFLTKASLFVVTIQQILFDIILLLQLSQRGWASANSRLWRIPILDYNCGYKSPTSHQGISDQRKVTDHASCLHFQAVQSPPQVHWKRVQVILKGLQKESKT